MKTAFFTQNVKQGGLDTFILNLITYWPTGDQITLFCNRSHPGLPMLSQRLEGKAKVIPYDFWIAQDISQRLLKTTGVFRLAFRVFFWVFGFLYLLVQTSRLFKEVNPDRLMVINGGHPGGDACLAATIAWAKTKPVNPAWHNFHNLVLPYPNNILRSVKERVIDYFLVRSAAGFVTVSAACMATLKTRRSLARSKSTFIYNGIAPMVFTPETSLADDLGLPDDTLLILMLAVYEPRKGHAFIIRAMDEVVQRVPTAAMVICGDGSPEEIEQVREIRNSSPVSNRIFLLEHRTDVSSLLSQAALLVLPSQEQESFGYTAIEAMACECPVVVTDVGGLPEVVDDGCSGYVVSRNDPNAFAERIVSLLQDKALRQRMGIAGAQRCRLYFNAERMAVNYHSLLETGSKDMDTYKSA